MTERDTARAAAVALARSDRASDRIIRQFAATYGALATGIIDGMFSGYSHKRVNGRLGQRSTNDKGLRYGDCQGDQAVS